jgi:hypothetical protein
VQVRHTAQSISDSFRDSLPFGNPQELKLGLRKCSGGGTKTMTVGCSPVTAESLDEEHGGAGGINESAAERGHRQFVTDWHRVSAE